MKQNKQLQFGWSTSSLSSSRLTRGSIIAESGRSMVEMLAVVALIGILSMLALAGFAWAMDKYRSNVLTNDIYSEEPILKNKWIIIKCLI